VSALHPPRSEMAIPYRFYGVALVGGTLVPLSFHAFNENVGGGAHESWAGMSGVEQMILILVLAAAVLIVAYLLQAKTAACELDDRPSLAESLSNTIRLQSVPLGLLGFFAFLAVWGPMTTDAWVPTIAANAAMVALAFWLIRLGLTEDRGRP